MTERDGAAAGARPTAGGEKSTLAMVLGINLAMFVVELVAGWLAESMGLIADSLDMLADAGVYGAAWLAVGSNTARQARAARASGVIQLVLAAAVAAEVVRRAYAGSAPVPLLMIAVSALALVANAVCLALLRKHRHGGVHMRASWIFTSTDVQANAGVILAGVLVPVTGTSWPDLLIGLVVCGLVVRGGVRILRQVRLATAPG